MYRVKQWDGNSDGEKLLTIIRENPAKFDRNRLSRFTQKMNSMLLIRRGERDKFVYVCGGEFGKYQELMQECQLEKSAVGFTIWSKVSIEFI